MSSQQWRCPECNHVGETKDLLTAPSPFNPDDQLVGCPDCKSVAAFIALCDEPGCQAEVSCGWPTKNPNDAWGGYRQTCFKHSNWT